MCILSIPISVIEVKNSITDSKIGRAMCNRAVPVFLSLDFFDQLVAKNLSSTQGYTTFFQLFSLPQNYHFIYLPNSYLFKKKKKNRNRY